MLGNVDEYCKYVDRCLTKVSAGTPCPQATASLLDTVKLKNVGMKTSETNPLQATPCPFPTWAWPGCCEVLVGHCRGQESGSP